MPATTRSSPVSRSWTVGEADPRLAAGLGLDGEGLEPEPLAPVTGCRPTRGVAPWAVVAEDEVRRRLQTQQSPGHLLPGQGLAQLRVPAGGGLSGDDGGQLLVERLRAVGPARLQRLAQRPALVPAEVGGDVGEGVVAHGLVERLVLGRSDLGDRVGDAGVGGRQPVVEEG